MKKSKSRVHIIFSRDVDASGSSGEEYAWDKNEDILVQSVEKNPDFDDMSILVLLGGDRVPVVSEDFEILGNNPPAGKNAIDDAVLALKFIDDHHTQPDENSEAIIDLKGLGIDRDPASFNCTNTAVILAKMLKKHGAEVYGFPAEDNPTASIADDYDGHDFAVLPDGTIIDWWRTIHTMRQHDIAVIKPRSREYKEYGDPKKWKKFKHWNHADWKWTKNIPPIDEIKSTNPDAAAGVREVLLAIQKAEKAKSKDARNALAMEFFGKKALRNFKTETGRVETWWDTNSRNWITQRFDTSNNEIESDYSGDKLGAALSHVWMLNKLMGVK